jgi:peptidylprolyl isomerase
MNIRALAILCLATACTQSTPDAKTDTAAKAEAKTDEPKAADAGDQPAEPDKPKPRGKQVPPPEDVAAAPSDATKTASGLAYKILQKGTGDATPSPNDSVKVLMTGWSIDGTTVETTESTGKPKTMPMGKSMPGLTEGLALMHAGERARFWIPEELAWKGQKGRPAGTLVYDVELQEILAAPTTPTDVAAAPADAKKTKSGIAYKVLTAGTGKEHPHEWDKVTVNYSGWTTDGKMFDSSVTRGKPASFNLKQVIPGWTEGIPLMVQGEKTRFWIPKELAYEGKPGKPQGMLVFDVELVEFEKLPEPPPPPETPKDVEAAPKDAKKTASGLMYKVLTKGKGGDKPKADSRVTVHYSGWTTDGKMFDSSVVRNRPATFPLGNVIKGWTEGLQLMAVGEKTRFWIPEELAYQGKPGKPAGMLVFDVELIEFK